MIRRLLLALLPLLFAVSCSVFFGEDAKDDGEGGDQGTKVPDALLRSFVRSAVDPRGRIQWQLKAREGRIFNEANKIYVTDFILYSFAEDGTLRSTIRARRGIIDNNNGSIIARKNVVLRAENGRVLETEELFANNNDKIISNEVLNRITQEDGTVMIGTHLWSHNDLKVVKLRGTQGEAPEGSEGGLFGDEGSSSSASRSRASSSRSSLSSRASPAGTTASASSPSSARSAAAGSSRASAASGSSSQAAWLVLPDLPDEELERLRTELAFPVSRAVSSSPAGATVSAPTSRSSSPSSGAGMP